MKHPDRKTRPGGRSGKTGYAVYDANSRRRLLEIAVLILLVLSPLLAAQAAFGFPLRAGLLPGLGEDEPKVRQTSQPHNERQEEDRRPKLELGRFGRQTFATRQ